MKAARVAVALLVTTIAWWAAGSTALAQAQARTELQITGVSTDGHPRVVIEAVVPDVLVDGVLPAEAWTLLEEGAPREFQVTALGEDATTIVLALDTSGSMQGDPLLAAKAAARRFIESIPAHIAVGLIGFGDTPQQVAAPGTDRTALLAGLDQLQAQGETALHDAVATGVVALSAAEGRRRLVLLSDGGDTVSQTTLQAASAAAVSADVSIHVVSLETDETDLGALQSLATVTSGSVAAASDPTALEAQFAELLLRLTRTYRLSFVSESRGPTAVRLEARLPTALAEAALTVDYPTAAPATRPSDATDPPVVARPLPYRAPTPVLAELPWLATAGIAGIGFALVLLALLMLTADPRAKGLPRQRRVHMQTVGEVTSRAVELAQGRLRDSDVERGLGRTLRAAGSRMQPAEALVLAVCVVVAAAGLGYVLLGPIPALALAALAVLLLALVPGLRAANRRQKFDEQVGDVLQLLAGNLRAGFGLTQALSAVAREVEAPASQEFGQVVAEIRLGRDPRDALGELADRMGSVDLDWAVQAMAIHQEIGGDLAKILDSVGETIRERGRIKGQIRALSAEGRLSAIILVALPLIMAAFMRWRNPEYMGELTSSPAGYVLIGGAVVLVILGSFWLSRIVKIRF